MDNYIKIKNFGFDDFDVKNIIYDINNKIVIPFTALPFYKDMQKKVNGGDFSECYFGKLALYG